MIKEKLKLAHLECVFTRVLHNTLVEIVYECMGSQWVILNRTDVDAGVDKGGPCVQVTSILPLYSNTTTKAPDIWIPL